MDCALLGFVIDLAKFVVHRKQEEDVMEIQGDEHIMCCNRCSDSERYHSW